MQWSIGNYTCLFSSSSFSSFFFLFFFWGWGLFIKKKIMVYDIILFIKLHVWFVISGRSLMYIMELMMTKEHPY
jgi:hypothetical protein